MLTAEDMEKYGIDPDSTDYEAPSVRRSFWRVLDVAREQCGFRIAGDKVLMQFYPSPSGGELFVTKLGKIASGAERTISKSGNVAMMSSRSVIYRFSELEALLQLARRLAAEGYELFSEVYAADDGSYYMLCEERNVSGFLSELAVLGEFAAEVPSTLEPYLKEHTEKVISGNAISILSEL